MNVVMRYQFIYTHLSIYLCNTCTYRPTVISPAGAMAGVDNILNFQQNSGKTAVYYSELLQVVVIRLVGVRIQPSSMCG